MPNPKCNLCGQPLQQQGNTTLWKCPGCKTPYDFPEKREEEKDG